MNFTPTEDAEPARSPRDPSPSWPFAELTKAIYELCVELSGEPRADRDIPWKDVRRS